MQCCSAGSSEKTKEVQSAAVQAWRRVQQHAILERAEEELIKLPALRHHAGM